MSNHRFKDLCQEVCKQAGIEAPALPQGEVGTASLSLQVAGIDTTLAHVPYHAPGTVLTLMEMGAVPTDRELPALLALLDANFTMQGENTLSIGRNPAGGEAILQASHRLGDVTGSDIHASVVQMAGWVHQWQRDYFLDEAGQAAAQPFAV